VANSFLQTDFEKFLALLDADRETAGVKYESLRVRLIKFFEWRNCETAEELADTVFDRVLRKIAEGERIQNLRAYSATVAQFVFKENLRNLARQNESLEENPNALNFAEQNPTEASEIENRRFDCLEKCLSAMDLKTRKLLIAYHDTDERTIIRMRRQIAESLEISLNTLRIRVCRLKGKLENCVHNCCADSGER
jgi:DNA-directed RNA polymerase specialized sigma24 family protein